MKSIIFTFLVVITVAFFSCANYNKVSENHVLIMDSIYPYEEIDSFIVADLTDDTVFVEIQDTSDFVKAQFPGDDLGRITFLAENLRYPEWAKEAGIQGTAFVQFVVEKDGSITNIKCKKELGGGIEHECIRVVRLMPNWIPATYKGEIIRSRFVLPITFQLAN